MPMIKDLHTRLCAVVTGQYLLTDSVDRQTQHGDQFKMMQLEDASGDLCVYCWERSGLLHDIPWHTPTPLEATLYVRSFNGQVIADLRGIRKVETGEVENAAALLPFTRCPENTRDALTRLVSFVEQLEPVALREFLNRVLLDERVADGLLTCKASQAHHHNLPGGLLTHSVEVMAIAEAMARAGRLSVTESAITAVAALLHDLGKLRTVGSGSVRPRHYQVVRHETQTNRLLEVHFEWLRIHEPDIAAGLEYTLDFIAQPRSVRGHARFVGAELVSSADQISAALDNNKRLEDLLTKVRPRGQAKPSATPRIGAVSSSTH